MVKEKKRLMRQSLIPPTIAEKKQLQLERKNATVGRSSKAKLKDADPEVAAKPQRIDPKEMMADL